MMLLAKPRSSSGYMKMLSFDRPIFSSSMEMSPLPFNVSVNASKSLSSK